MEKFEKKVEEIISNLIENEIIVGENKNAIMNELVWRLSWDRRKNYFDTKVDKDNGKIIFYESFTNSKITYKIKTSTTAVKTRENKRMRVISDIKLISKKIKQYKEKNFSKKEKEEIACHIRCCGLENYNAVEALKIFSWNDRAIMLISDTREHLLEKICEMLRKDVVEDEENFKYLDYSLRKKLLKNKTLIFIKEIDNGDDEGTIVIKNSNFVQEFICEISPVNIGERKVYGLIFMYDKNLV